MPRSLERQLLRVTLLGALAVLLTGGLLWMARGLALAPRPPARGAPPAALPEQAVPVAHVAAAAPLPTIARRQVVSPTVVAAGTTPIPTFVHPAISSGGDILTTGVSTTDAVLTARLMQHLACLVPQAQHDTTLDARALELAQQDDTPIPSSGMVQIAGTDAQRILLSVRTLADLQAADGRCGETLIFGIPPLEWLPPGTYFGLGVATRANGAVVVVTH